jgi:hypothetical protein
MNRFGSHDQCPLYEEDQLRPFGPETSRCEPVGDRDPPEEDIFGTLTGRRPTVTAFRLDLMRKIHGLRATRIAGIFR